MLRSARTVALGIILSLLACTRTGKPVPVLAHSFAYTVLDALAAEAKTVVMAARMDALTAAADLAQATDTDVASAVTAAAAAFDAPGGPLAAFAALVAAKDAYREVLLTAHDGVTWDEAKADLRAALIAYDALRTALPGKLPEVPEDIHKLLE